MAEIQSLGVRVQLQVSLTLDEEELRALDAIAGYGADEFLKVFYDMLGRAYLEPYERGVRRLFEAVRGCAVLARDADECREFMERSKTERLKLMRKS
jgi:hypothetical protein